MRLCLFFLLLLAVAVLHPATPSGLTQIAVFRNASQKYTLPVPVGTGKTLVFVNGLLMCQGLDYTIGNGTVLTFTGQTVGGNPVIQVWLSQ